MSQNIKFDNIDNVGIVKPIILMPISFKIKWYVKKRNKSIWNKIKEKPYLIKKMRIALTYWNNNYLICYK